MLQYQYVLELLYVHSWTEKEHDRRSINLNINLSIGRNCLSYSKYVSLTPIPGIKI